MISNVGQKWCKDPCAISWQAFKENAMVYFKVVWSKPAHKVYQMLSKNGARILAPFARKLG